MTESEADLLALLRGLDDPGWLEWPQHYDRGETAARFGGLLTDSKATSQLSARMSRTLRTPASTDASSCRLTRPYAEPGSSSA
ncbi:hypothetical protein ACFWDI_27590 [Streptomyces sp. NPDC060064]|uniref:hypothetical protein n=1 Tax=Streptomyces sp. NPDC060064 TaxID=3347049 RepID=UPI0036B2C757